MADFPRSLSEFEQRFGDEAACAEYLIATRWPDGFVCPGCAGTKAWRFETEPWTYECARCGHQTSVTAGTIMDHSRLPLTTWFWAAYVMATQPNGISALQLQRELTLGSYKTAWLLCAKLRRSMVAPERTSLSGLVEIDKTEITWRSKNGCVTGNGQSHRSRMLLVGAVEVQDLRLGRVCLSTVPDYSATSLYAFLAANLMPGTTVRTDGWLGDCRALGINQDLQFKVVAAGHNGLFQIRRVFSDLEAWALGVPHGLRREHLQSFLDEFVFRFNSRRNRNAAFSALLGIAAAQRPVTYKMLVTQAAAA
jgi:Zn ribbon nucleic-acid-binding protein